MNRAKDLDTIAPDDLTAPIPPKKKKSPKTIPHSQSPQFKQKIHDILGHSGSCFSSFLVNPKAFDFPEREKDEEIILAVRSHWLINLKWVIIAVIMVFVPSLFKFLNLLQSLPLRYQIVSSLFWYLLIFIYIFERFLDWYFDVFIITDKRLVDIKFNNLLNKHFAEANIDMIQDVSSSVRGVLGTFFNFGTILVQTASEINQIIFRSVPNPEKIIKLLQELREGGCK